jgi:hypothetical protein
MITSLMLLLYQRKVKTNITEKEPRPNTAKILRTQPKVPRFSVKTEYGAPTSGNDLAVPFQGLSKAIKFRERNAS